MFPQSSFYLNRDSFECQEFGSLLDPDYQLKYEHSIWQFQDDRQIDIYERIDFKLEN